MRKFLCTILALVTIPTVIVVCSGCDDGSTTTTTTPVTTTTLAPSSDVVGAGDVALDVDVMLWSGDSVYYQDIGSNDWAASDITGQNVAAVYALAKAFKANYPNVRINLWAKTGDPNGNATSWEAEIDNFRQAYNKYPDIWASNSLSRDMGKGLVFDLSVFSDTASYQRMNPALMEMSNFYGFQAALPQYILPWGIYVNKQLAAQNNIATPGIDWDWEEYTDFVTSAKIANNFYGSWDASMDIIRWAILEKQLMTDEIEGDDYVNINTTAFKTAIRNLSEQSMYAFNSLNARGEISEENVTALGNLWGYDVFRTGHLLTYSYDPWMLGGSNLEGSSFVSSTDWDIYPAPDLGGSGNFVSAVLDPLVVYNYCKMDGNNELSDAEKAIAKVSYDFAAFWVADTVGWQARANQDWTDGNGVLNSSLNDSFPMVVGDEFDSQMEIWYSTPGHAPYENATKFPGFARVVELWEEGKIYAASDKSYPLTYKDSEGGDVQCFDVIHGFGNPDYVGGVTIEDPTWASTYISKIPGATGFNARINTHLKNAWAQLRERLISQYGYTQEYFDNYQG